MNNDFEKAFSDFLERREYDKAENALFSMVRISFIAGWLSAGGNPPLPHKLIEIKHKNIYEIVEGIETDIVPE